MKKIKKLATLSLVLVSIFMLQNRCLSDETAFIERDENDAGVVISTPKSFEELHQTSDTYVLCLALAKRDPEECSAHSLTGANVQSCMDRAIFYRAIAYDLLYSCDEIKDFSRFFCRAILLHDSAECEKIDFNSLDEESKEKPPEPVCKALVALDRSKCGSEKICKNITEENCKDSEEICKDSIELLESIAANDSMLCDNIADREMKNLCKAFITYDDGYCRFLWN